MTFFSNTAHLRSRFTSGQQEPPRSAELCMSAQCDRQPKDTNPALSWTWASQVLKPLRDRNITRWCCFTTWHVLALVWIYSNTGNHLEDLMTYQIMRYCFAISWLVNPLITVILTTVIVGGWSTSHITVLQL